jgi:glycine dehydrogenase
LQGIEFCICRSWPASDGWRCTGFAAGHEPPPLKNAPHTAASLLAADWPQAYSREQAAFPVPALKAGKFFPPVGRVDNVHGDRNLFCSCVPVADFA